MGQYVGLSLSKILVAVLVEKLTYLKIYKLLINNSLFNQRTIPTTVLFLV